MRRTIRMLGDGSLQCAGAQLGYDAYDIAFFMADPDETTPLTIDWTGFLGTDTITLSEWDSDNLTVASEANTTKAASCKISAVPDLSCGTAINTITTTDGQIARRRVRFYGRQH